MGLVLHRELLIDGQFYGGSCDQSVAKTVSRNPYSGHTVGTAAEASWTEALAAADAADRAFRTWRTSTAIERSDLLFSIKSLILQRRDELASLAVEEIGKPIAFARAEVDRMALTFELAAEAALDFGEETIDVGLDPRGAGVSVSAKRFPIGPILAIAPYNWPFNLAAHKVAPALAVGATVVLKGSELAPLCTLTLGRLIHEAGCPAGVVNVIAADARVSERLAAVEAFKMISFTGSPQVGWHIKRSFPERRIALELGGNAFVILAEDADLDRAIPQIVTGAYGYAGQVCISAQHVLVAQSRIDEVRERLIEATIACPSGDPADPNVICGPMIDERAAERVESWIKEAVSSGASLLAGGARSRCLVEPTLLEKVPPTARLYNDEAFAPVLTLEPYDSLDAAYTRVNRSPFGIHASIYTQNADVASRAFNELEVGGVLQNFPPTLRFDAAPYGGVKRSGFGREGIRYAMDEMTELKTFTRLENAN